MPAAGCEAPDPSPPDPGPVPDGLTAEASARLVWCPGRTNVEAAVRLRNCGPDPAWVLQPFLLGGSRDGRYMPAWVLTVLDPAGRPVPRVHVPGCGTVPDLKWPEDYLSEIRPGAALEVRLIDTVEPLPAGRYTVRFEYAYLPGPADLPPPAEAWRGRVTAGDVVVDYDATGPPGFEPPKDPEAPDMPG
jgi:hypothetical protein